MDIYLYGEIGFWGVTANDVIKMLEGHPEGEALTIHINSPGGEVYEGLAISNLLSKYNTEAIIEGLCASMATVIAVNCKSVKMYDNATFMVHNPYTGLKGDADQLRKAADELQRMEDMLVASYKAKTNLDEVAIKDLMKAETFLSAAQAKEIGFVDEVITPNFKAVAYMKPKDQLDKESKTLLDKIKVLLGMEPVPAPAPAPAPAPNPNTAPAPAAQTKKKLSTGQEITLSGGEGDPLLGQSVTMTNEAGETVPAPDGEHTLEDGTVITVSGGVITEAESAEAMEKKKIMQAIEQYKQQLAGLEASLAEAKMSNEQMKNSLTEAMAKIEEYAAIPLGKPAPVAQAPAGGGSDKSEVIAALKENAKKLSKKTE